MGVIGMNYNRDEFAKQFPAEVYAGDGFTRYELRDLDPGLLMVIERQADIYMTPDSFLGQWLDGVGKMPYVDFENHEWGINSTIGRLPIELWRKWRLSGPAQRYWVPFGASTKEELFQDLKRALDFGEEWNYEHVTVTIYHYGLEIASDDIGGIESDVTGQDFEHVIGQLVVEINNSLSRQLVERIAKNTATIQNLMEQSKSLNAVSHQQPFVKDLIALGVKL